MANNSQNNAWDSFTFLKHCPKLFMALGLGIIILYFAKEVAVMSSGKPFEPKNMDAFLGLALCGIGYAHHRISKLEEQRNTQESEGADAVSTDGEADEPATDE
ncbi:MAG: hypothetical protein HOH50_13015 [Planctomycetaceae bacterium]|jgi:hypothetical protein|nr:hypothetical protein [Planctomycetaceae bacterium]MBT5885140.1 hypothetical protein [Planctomycetaceae bacterium]